MQITRKWTQSEGKNNYNQSHSPGINNKDGPLSQGKL